MSCQPMWRISRSDLEGLLSALTVNSVKLTGSVVTSLSPLAVSPADMPSIYYNLEGAGWMMVGDDPPIELPARTLVIVPRGQPVRIKASADRHAQPLNVVGASQEVAADEGEAQLSLIGGHFSAAFGASVDLFEGLAAPIVEQFDAADQLDYQMKSALAELTAQEVGTVAMATAFLKQVLVTLLRRSLNSNNVWVERACFRRDGCPAWRPALRDQPVAESRSQPFGVHGALCRRVRLCADGGTSAIAHAPCGRDVEHQPAVDRSGLPRCRLRQPQQLLPRLPQDLWKRSVGLSRVAARSTEDGVRRLKPKAGIERDDGLIRRVVVRRGGKGFRSSMVSGNDDSHPNQFSAE
jgi:Cupin